MESILTIDYSKFGYRELDIAGKLLSLYAKRKVDFLGDGLTVNFNLYSGYVFLSDNEYNVGILDSSEKEIVQFFTCMECGYEGTQEQAEYEERDFIRYSGFCSKDCALVNL